MDPFTTFEGASQVRAARVATADKQYGVDQDDTTSMYSAAPSNLTEQVLVPPARTGLERGLDAMSLSSHVHSSAMMDYYDGADEFREEDPPFGYGIQHACR